MIKKTLRYIATLVLLIVILSVSFSSCNCQKNSINKDGKVFFLGSNGSIIAAIDVEIADTPESRAKGLMYRELSDFSSGMLFVYQDVEPRTFWMRNTPTPLDIIFVGEDSYILNIVQKTTPMSGQLYSSKGSANYIVEVKAGFVERYGIKEGTKIRWERLKE
jgi:uncharacterized membrane protein (UPF0127 family)